jgi:ATPase subunit of ABC transporter with duplicated ATPase domains
MRDIVGPFNAEFWFGDRIGVVGPNGTGKSHFMKLLAGHDIKHTGEFMLGARVRPAFFSQVHERPDLDRDESLLDMLVKQGLERGGAMRILKRYELAEVAALPFRLLSGGQQARLQILLMEAQGSTMLLLDEPTDNLDIDSAEALEEALLHYEGTVLAVTHDRWLMRLLDRFLVFRSDGTVVESPDPPYGEVPTRA